MTTKEKYKQVKLSDRNKVVEFLAVSAAAALILFFFAKIMFF